LNPKHGENRFKLTILAGLVTAMDYTNIHDKAQPLLSDEFRAQRESEKRQLKDLLTNEIKQDIFENFTYGGLDTLAKVGEIMSGVESYFSTQKALYLEKLLGEHGRIPASYKVPGYKERMEEFDQGFNKLLTNKAVIDLLVKLYPQLYVKLALMFIDPDTKTYSKPKIESNCIECLGIFLLLWYLGLLNLSIKGAQWNTFKNEHVVPIIGEIRTYIDTQYPGIYDFIGKFYDDTTRTNNSMV
jgi:hypothetical protein